MNHFAIKLISNKRNSFNRLVFLLIAILYSFACVNSLLQYPFTKSSLGVSYVLLWCIPTILLLIHFFFNRLITWLILVILLSTMYIISSVGKLKEAWYWSQGIKWEPTDFWKALLINVALFVFGLGLLYLLRPKINKIQSAS